MSDKDKPMDESATEKKKSGKLTDLVEEKVGKRGTRRVRKQVGQQTSQLDYARQLMGRSTDDQK